MNKPCLVGYISDLHFQSKVEEIAEAKKLDFYFARHGESLSQIVKNLSASLMVVDLTEPSLDWIFKHISEIIARDHTFPIIAFVSPVQEAVRERAEKYGCYKIFEKPELNKSLPPIIERILRKSL